MPGLLKEVDPQGLLEYSVVYTDRALNHMSQSFQGVMRDINQSLCKIYGAVESIVVPGSGTFAMEAVARQFATNQDCLILRNGWFSYRWSQILEQGHIPKSSEVLKARPISSEPQSPFQPAPLEEAREKILNCRPKLVFAPHVETSSGMILPDEYLKGIAQAAHEVGALFVLDCIASGAMWVDMRETGVDILISAPQKGWSSTPCCGLVMLSERAQEFMKDTTSSSFACNLAQWQNIMKAYIGGGHAYYATMPTDGLRQFRDVIKEAEALGFENLKNKQSELGSRMRQLLLSYGIKNVAAPGFEAPGVIVSYTDDTAMKSGAKFVEYGIQIAAGVPLACDEPEEFRTFRLGLFGLDKLQDIDRTVSSFERALKEIVTQP